MKKHAFLVIVHKQPELLARILRILSKDNHYFFIHIDKKIKDFDAYINAAQHIDNVFFLQNRSTVYHAGVSLLRITIDMLKVAAQNEIHFDYYHLISGQDYPLRSNEQFDEFFDRTDHSFMYIDSGNFRQSMIPHYDRCVNEYHFNNTSTIFSKVYEKLKLGKMLSVFVHRKPVPNVVGGWEWFSWNRATAEYVLNFLYNNPAYLARFNHTASSDEIFFSTLLQPKSDELKIETQNPLRYISWHPHRSITTNYRPFNFNELDYKFIIDSAAFFCRKVDAVESADLLDLIDNQRNNLYDINLHDKYV
jgi:hypothetical protein